jgi:3-isopropylmalate/(R)-2-methylmalate dehydratase small subunit
MSFEPFTVVSGPAIPLLLSNVDTDVIIRIERMTALPRQEWGRWALEPLRYLPDGGLDPDSILNQPHFARAPVLLAGPNFGCGSSREPAVTALQGHGVRCVVAPSFGDIFFANCFQNGMLPICLPLTQVEALAVQCSGGAPVTVDLERCVVLAPDGTAFAFQVDATRREALLKGLDDIGLTLQDEALISAWQRADRLRRPWAWPRPR